MPKTYRTDFSEYATGAQPNDWTERFHIGNGWSVENFAEASNGVALQKLSETSTDRRAISWDIIDADPERADLDILIKFYIPSTSSVADIKALLRGSGTSTSESGYSTGYDQAGDRLIIISYDNSNIGLVGDTIITVLADTWYYQRIRVQNDSFKAKVWEASSNEPTGWDIEELDSTILSTGWVGLYTSDIETYYVDEFSVGTGGADAPMGDPTTFNEALSVKHNNEFLEGGTFDGTFDNTFSQAGADADADAFAVVEAELISDIVNAAGQLLFEDVTIGVQNNFEPDSAGSEAHSYVDLSNQHSIDWEFIARAVSSLEFVSKHEVEVAEEFIIKAGISFDTVQGIEFDSEGIIISIELPTGRTLTVRITGGTKFTPNIHSK